MRHLHRRRRIHVRIHLGHEQHQAPRQVVGMVHVRRSGVVRGDGPAHPLLVPPDLVHPVVVTAGVRIRHVIELGMEQYGACGILATRRRAIDAHTRQIVIVRILRGHRLVPQDAIRESGIAQVAPRHVMKGLRPIRRAHSVHLDHDEAEFGDGVHAALCAEGLWHKRPLGPGVDVLDHGIRAGRVEVRRTDDDAPDVGNAVARLRRKHLRVLPSRGEQGRCVALFQFHDERLIARAPEHGLLRQVHALPRVHVELLVGRERDGVIAVGISERGQAGAVEVHAVVVNEIGIPARVHAAGGEPDLARGGVHGRDCANHPLAFRDLVLHLPGDAVVQIEMVPAIALGGPDDLLAITRVLAKALAGVLDEGLRRFFDECPPTTGGGVDLDHAIDLVAALVVLKRDRAAVGAPLEPGIGIGVREKLQIPGQLLPGLHVEQDGMIEIHHVARLAIEIRRVFRLHLIGW